MSGVPYDDRVCPVCKTLFGVMHGNQKYCSKKCCTKAHHQSPAYKAAQKRLWTPEYWRAARKRWATKLKLEVLIHYGGSVPKCQCPGNCGEQRLEFLTVDHIGGGGGKHRKELKVIGLDFYAWLRKSGYPPGYRVLCMNCNHSFGVHGYCPHEGILAEERAKFARSLEWRT